MNRAELLARYMEYGHDLEVLESRDFYEFLMNNKDNVEISHFNPMPSTDAMEVRIDGWKYCHYATSYPVGWEGDHDCDVFDFRVKQTTKAEMAELEAIFSQKNDYTKWDGVIGDEDFYPHTEELSGGY